MSTYVRSARVTAVFALAAFAAVRPAHSSDDAAAPPAIEQIIVTASPISSSQSGLATIVGQVGRDKILENGGATLADALADIPGVTGSGFASGASRPVIRGFDANRVRILENGVGSFDVSDIGPDHGVPIDPLSTQKIEVVRGAATLRYGSQAIGGVVNAINNRIPLTLPDKPVSGEFTGSYATGADAKQGSGMVDFAAGNLAFHADGFARHTDDYDIPGGKQSNSYFKGSGASGGASYFMGDSRIGAAVVHYDAKYGIPGEVNYIDMKQTKGLFGSSFALDAGALQTFTLDGGYADYTHSEKEPDGTPGATFNDKEWDTRGELLMDDFGVFSSAALGAQVQSRKFSALGEGEDYLLPTKTDTAAGFGFAAVPLVDKALTLQLGARVEHVDVKGTPVSNVPTKRSFTPVSGSASLVLNAAKDVTFGLSLSSTARAPAQTELFARGPHDGPATFETGDPTLKTERANSLEATVHADMDRVQFEGAVWGSNFDNYIYGRLTGRTCDEDGVCILDGPEELKEMFYEQRDAKFRGVEGKVTVDLADTDAGTLSANALGDYVRATLDGAGPVPRIPPYHIGGGLDWKSDIVDAGFLLKYAGAQNRISVGETPTDGYTSLSARIVLRPFLANKNVEFLLVGSNLTNSTQRNAVALNKDDVILPGRDIRLIARASF